MTALLAATLAIVAVAAPARPAWHLSDWRQRFTSAWRSDHAREWLPDSRSGDSGSFYWAGYGISAATDYYLATGDAAYVEAALALARNMMSSATTGDHGIAEYPSSNGARGWRIDGHRIGGGRWSANLGEAMAFRHVARLLRVVEQDPALRAAHAADHDALLAFTERHVFQKWWNADPAHTMIHRENANMRSLWGMIAFDLWLITKDPTWKPIYRSTWQSVAKFVRSCLQTADGKYVIWLYPYPGGAGSEPQAVLDTDHAGQVIAAVVEMWEQRAAIQAAGSPLPWTDADMRAFAKMVSVGMWQERSRWFSSDTSGRGTFRDLGVHAGDGVARLGAFDAMVQRQLELGSEAGHVGWLPSLYYAVGARNHVLLSATPRR